jgi:hypothetical protein
MARIACRPAGMNTLSKADAITRRCSSVRIHAWPGGCRGPWRRRCQRSRAGCPASRCENAPLPKLPDIFFGIYVRGGAEVEEREQLADAVAAALSPQPAAGSFAPDQQNSAA